MRKIHDMGNGMFAFRCPGCNCSHYFLHGGVEEPGRPQWTWNGSYDQPTVTPSLMVNRGTPEQCHSYLREGNIQFLGDSHHELKGKTVELPYWEED